MVLNWQNCHLFCNFIQNSGNVSRLIFFDIFQLREKTVFLQQSRSFNAYVSLSLSWAFTKRYKQLFELKMNKGSIEQISIDLSTLSLKFMAHTKAHW